MQDALEDGALAHASLPVHLDRDLGVTPSQSRKCESEGNAASSLATATELTRIDFCSVSLPYHCISVCIALGCGERGENSTALPILGHGDHKQCTMKEEAGDATRDTRRIAGPRHRRRRSANLVKVREKRSMLYSLFARNTIRLFLRSLVGMEYARPTDVTPTLNADHRQRTTAHGRTRTRGADVPVGRDGVARARSKISEDTQADKRARSNGIGREGAGARTGRRGRPSQQRRKRRSGRARG